jgi:hypothetical protein
MNERDDRRDEPNAWSAGRLGHVRTKGGLPPIQSRSWLSYFVGWIEWVVFMAAIVGIVFLIIYLTQGHL